MQTTETGEVIPRQVPPCLLQQAAHGPGLQLAPFDLVIVIIDQAVGIVFDLILAKTFARDI